jgi:hypothetical protein
MPKSDAQVQAKLISYANIIPVLAQMQSPELIAYAADLFGVPEHLAGWNSERTHVDRLIKRFEALAQLYVEQFGDLPDTSLEPIVTAGVDPMTGEPVEQAQPSPAMEVAQRINDYSKIPVDVFLDNHDAIIDALRDWRATDAGRTAPNALVAAVALRTLLHHEGAAKQEAALNRRAIEAAAPMKEDAKADQAEAMAAQEAANEKASAEAAEQTEAQMLAQGADKIMEYSDRDEAREHEKEMMTAKQVQEQALKDQEAVRQAAQSAVTPTE